MKTMKQKTKYARHAAMLGLLMAGMNANAQGTWGGGGGILIKGAPELIDAHVNCEWNTVYGEALKLPLFQKMMANLEQVHPILAIETKIQMMKTPVCMANGTYFKKISLSMGPDFVMIRRFESGPQLAVRWFLDSKVYPDEIYVDSKEFDKLPQDQQAELMFHEVFHAFVPRFPAEGRDLKISSLGNSMLRVLNNSISRQELEMQLDQARVAMFSSEVDPLIDQSLKQILTLVDFGLEKEKLYPAKQANALATWKIISPNLATIRASFSSEANAILATAEARLFAGADRAMSEKDVDQLLVELDQGIPANDPNHSLLAVAIQQENEKAIAAILTHPGTTFDVKTKDAQLNRIVAIGLRNRNTILPVMYALSKIDRVSEELAILSLKKKAKVVIQGIVEKSSTDAAILNAMASFIARNPGSLTDAIENLVLDAPKLLTEMNAFGLTIVRDAFLYANESVFTKVLAKVTNINLGLNLQDDSLLLEMAMSGKLKDASMASYLQKVLARPDLQVNQENAEGKIPFQVLVAQEDYRSAGELARHPSFDNAIVSKWLNDPKRSFNQNKSLLIAAAADGNVGLLGALAKTKYFTRMDWIEVKTIVEIKFPNRAEIAAIVEGELK